jgi:LysM domain/N-acetylmuramoyl-L-alanine amidase
MTATPDQLLNALRAFGVQVHEHSGWRTRRHGAIDAKALMIHDSVTGSMSDERAAQFCQDGRSDLKGPLYSCMIGQDGQAHLIAHGMTWNAGKGNLSRLNQARSGTMPLGHELGRPSTDNTSTANSIVHGIAYTTAGAGPYSSKQLLAGHRVVAAYCRAEGWSPNGGAGSVIGHGEYSTRKVDPALDMGDLRRQVQKLLAGGGVTPGDGEQWHTVVSGDTLYSLAQRYNTTVDKIKQLNNLTSDKLAIGQRLRVR